MGKAKKFLSRIADEIVKRDEIVRLEELRLERMRDQGYEPYFHGSKADIQEIDLQKGEFQSFHAGTPQQAWNRIKGKHSNAGYSQYNLGEGGENIMPLAVRKGRSLKLPDIGDWNNLDDLTGVILRTPEFYDDPEIAEIRESYRDIYSGLLQRGDLDNITTNSEYLYLVDSLKEYIGSKGFRTIEYTNSHENDYGDVAAYRDPEARMALQKEKYEIQEQANENGAPPLGASMDEVKAFLNSPKDSAVYTPEQQSRLDEIGFQLERMDVERDNDSKSLIILNDGDVRSIFAGFDPRETGNAGMMRSSPIGTVISGVALGGLAYSDESEAGPFTPKTIADVVKRVGDLPPLAGQPATANIPSLGPVSLGGRSDIQRSAREVTEAQGIEYREVNDYRVPSADDSFHTNVAKEFNMMEHDPKNPRVSANYAAMVKEVEAQYEQMLRDGVQPYFITGEDPYAQSPYLALAELQQTGRLGVYPTERAFGMDQEFPDNPLEQESRFTLDGKPMLVNDLFRAVHDYYGHAKNSFGFRGMGEENAYRSHSGSLSDAAKRAAAVETRGQNSYLNWGPNAELNRTASAQDTIFSDQKIGELPAWAVMGNTPEAAARLSRTDLDRFDGALDEDGQVILNHHSPSPLDRIDPKYYGTGLSGRTRSEVNASTDPNWVPRSFFGVDTTDNPYKVERGLGGAKNQAVLNPEQIYDITRDPDGLFREISDRSPSGFKLSQQERANQLIKNIYDMNYSATLQDTPQGKVIQVFDPLNTTNKQTGAIDPKLLYSIPITGALATGAAMFSDDTEAGPVDNFIRGALRDADKRYTNPVGGSNPRKGLEGRVGDLDYTVENRLMSPAGDVNLYDFEGSPYILTQSDRSRAGGLLTSINGKQIDPIDLQGGRDFMFDQDRYAWSSAPAVTSKLDVLGKKLSMENQGQNPLLIPYSMAPTGIDFATLSLDAMINYARQGMSKKNIKALDNRIKTLIPEWGGIANPASNEIFRDVGGDIRKSITDIIDKDYRDVNGGLSVAEARVAVGDPAQLTVADGDITNVARMDSNRSPSASTDHPTYKSGLYGEGLGVFRDSINARDFLAGGNNRDVGDVLTTADMRALSMNPALQAGVVDERVLRNVYGGASPELLAATTGVALGGAAAVPAVTDTASDLQSRITPEAIEDYISERGEFKEWGDDYLTGVAKDAYDWGAGAAATLSQILFNPSGYTRQGGRVTGGVLEDRINKVREGFAPEQAPDNPLINLENSAFDAAVVKPIGDIYQWASENNLGGDDYPVNQVLLNGVKGVAGAYNDLKDINKVRLQGALGL